MDDTLIHKGLRKRLVEELKQKGIDNGPVLSAIEKVPRHLFMDAGFAHLAYRDRPFSIGEGQTLSQPYTVAVQSSLLDIKPRLRVLEIGTGSGYQAVILAEMGAIVFTVERHYSLFIKTRKLLQRMSYPINMFHGDGFAGLPGYPHFDRIIVTCAVAEIPENLVNQLKPEGKMVIPIGNDSGQVMTLVKKKEHGNPDCSEHGYYSFVPMLEGTVK